MEIVSIQTRLTVFDGHYDSLRKCLGIGLEEVASADVINHSPVTKEQLFGCIGSSPFIHTLLECLRSTVKPL